MQFGTYMNSGLNRRITARSPLYLEGKLILQIGAYQYNEQVYINNLSLKGIQLVFANNALMHSLLRAKDDKIPIIVRFYYNSEVYEFSCLLNWTKIYDIGERNFYVLIGLNYSEREKARSAARVVDLIYKLQLKSFIS